MIKKIVLGGIGLIVLVATGGALYVRSVLDPENVRLTLEQQATAALGEPVSVGAVALAYWPRAGVTLTDLAIGQPPTLSLKRTELSTAMRSLLSRRIEDADVRVEDSTVDLPRLLAALDRLGASSGDPAPTGEAPAGGTGVTLVNVRTIAFSNVRITAGPRSAVFDVRSSLAGDRLTIDRATVVSDVTTLEASGVVESLAQKRGKLAVTADPLDLDGLVVFAQEFAAAVGGQAGLQPGGPAAGGTAEPPALDFVLDLKAARGQAAGVAFDDLAATAHLTPAGIHFDPFGFGIFDGRMDGSVKVDVSGAEPALAVKARLSGVNMTRLTAFAGQPGSVTGTLAGTFAVKGSGVDPARALAGATGAGAVEVTDGAVKGLQLVRPIVLAFGKPDAAQPVGGGEAFSRLAAEYTLARGVLTFTELAFDSRDVELRGAGTLTMAGSALDVEAKAKLSKELTAQAGRDLVRFAAEAGQVVLPATITGTVENPRVGVDVGDVAKRAVTNELKRQTESVIKGLLGRKKPPK